MDVQRLILVVENDEATRAFLLENLAADGFRVAAASSPGEGLRAIEVRQPNLVVLDLALEDSSGLDLLDRAQLRPRRGRSRDEADARSSPLGSGVFASWPRQLSFRAGGRHVPRLEVPRRSR
jgi:CheY-like chemotaxis protein